jgi:hypothetical protein
VNVFGESTLRVFLAAIGAGFLLTAFVNQPAYPQAKIESAERAPEPRRTLPLSKFYDTPSPLAPGKPGDLIRSEEFDEYNLPFDITAVRILYHSRSARGQDVAASGVVLYPDAKPPAGGWPVIAWAHALNGVARQCAPSLARNLQHGPFLSMYVNLGYAVVATDYTGLGTNFRNAFSDIQSNANDLIYSVSAARAAVPQLSSRWIAIGIEEGGSAVVGVAELERDIRDSNYLGSIAISGLADLPDRYGHSGAHTAYETRLFLAYGIKALYPEFEVKDILTDNALALYSQIDQACAKLGGGSKLSPVALLKPNWESNRFVRQYFEGNSLGLRPARGPVLVISSELDASAPIQHTAQVVARMCKQGDLVQFERYPQSEKGRVFGDSVRDQISWIEGRFGGRRPPSNCSEQR